MNNNHYNEPKTQTLGETDNFQAWMAEEPDGETTYYLQIGRATINFFQEEWEQFLAFVIEGGKFLDAGEKACDGV